MIKSLPVNPLKLDKNLRNMIGNAKDDASDNEIKLVPNIGLIQEKAKENNLRMVITNPKSERKHKRYSSEEVSPKRHKASRSVSSRSPSPNQTRGYRGVNFRNNFAHQ